MARKWKEVLVEALEELGGEASLSKIYENVRQNPRGRILPRETEASIRNFLEVYSSDSKAFKGEDLFYLRKKGTGVWGLRQNKEKNEISNTQFDAEEGDSKKYISTTLAVREGQGVFRKQVLERFASKCCVTNCNVEKALQASHIKPFSGKNSNNVANGLALRADLHLLFDAHQWSIHPQKYTIVMSKELKKTEYGRYDGEKLNLPHISSSSLEYHYKQFVSHAKT